MPRRPRKKQLSGGAKLKAAGKHPVLLGIGEHDYKLIQEAATIERRPVSQFILHAAVRFAMAKVSEESRRNIWDTISPNPAPPAEDSDR